MLLLLEQLLSQYEAASLSWRDIRKIFLYFSGLGWLLCVCLGACTKMVQPKIKTFCLILGFIFVLCATVVQFVVVKLWKRCSLVVLFILGVAITY